MGAAPGWAPHDGGGTVSQRWGVELAIVAVFAAALALAVLYFREREPRVGSNRRVMVTGLLTVVGAVAFVAAWAASSPSTALPTVTTRLLADPPSSGSAGTTAAATTPAPVPSVPATAATPVDGGSIGPARAGATRDRTAPARPPGTTVPVAPASAPVPLAAPPAAPATLAAPAPIAEGDPATGSAPARRTRPDGPTTTRPPRTPTSAPTTTPRPTTTPTTSAAPTSAPTTTSQAPTTVPTTTPTKVPTGEHPAAAPAMAR
ncbi:MAG: hypothetical protein QOF00_3099 [Pseudonocardiales bacterium]|nr:hypothetical protein [Pseudonocardiales bacterium]